MSRPVVDVGSRAEVAGSKVEVGSRAEVAGSHREHRWPLPPQLK